MRRRPEAELDPDRRQVPHLPTLAEERILLLDEFPIHGFLFTLFYVMMQKTSGEIIILFSERKNDESSESSWTKYIMNGGEFCLKKWIVCFLGCLLCLFIAVGSFSESETPKTLSWRGYVMNAVWASSVENRSVVSLSVCLASLKPHDHGNGVKTGKVFGRPAILVQVFIGLIDQLPYAIRTPSKDDISG